LSARSPFQQRRRKPHDAERKLFIEELRVSRLWLILPSNLNKICPIF
jgi:hypothetical protein